MEKIKSMENYVNKTRNMPGRYDLKGSEIQELLDLTFQKPYDAIALSFNYGRAKGYRAAKREARA